MSISSEIAEELSIQTRDLVSRFEERANSFVGREDLAKLQQLHSHFVSTLPRMYDRVVIADAFALPYEVLERSAQLETGEWLFVSFKAAKQRNVPVFLKTQNNESLIADYLKQRRASLKGSPGVVRKQQPVSTQ